MAADDSSARRGDNPGGHDLAELRVRQAEHGDLRDIGMMMEELLHLRGMDLLTPRLICSLQRPTMRKLPSSRRRARSSVYSQPSPSMARAEPAGSCNNRPSRCGASGKLAGFARRRVGIAWLKRAFLSADPSGGRTCAVVDSELRFHPARRPLFKEGADAFLGLFRDPDRCAHRGGSAQASGPALGLVEQPLMAATAWVQTGSCLCPRGWLPEDSGPAG